MSQFNSREVLAITAGAVSTHTDAEGALIIRIEALPRRADGEIDLTALDLLLRPFMGAL